MRVKLRIILFNKPYGVLCQFRASSDRATLAEFIAVPGVYPAGRLDATSEGLLLLTDDGRLQHRISDPRHKVEKVYWAQVEGTPDAKALDALRHGVVLDGRETLPAKVTPMAEPDVLWPRDPPIRYRKNVPAGWLEIRIREGRNRQVRRMTASVGHPTLRLIRYAVGPYTFDGLVPGARRDADDVMSEPRAENTGGRS